MMGLYMCDTLRAHPHTQTPTHTDTHTHRHPHIVSTNPGITLEKCSNMGVARGIGIARETFSPQVVAVTGSQRCYVTVWGWKSMVGAIWGLLNRSTGRYFYKRLKPSLHKTTGNLLENLFCRKCSFKNNSQPLEKTFLSWTNTTPKNGILLNKMACLLKSSIY